MIEKWEWIFEKISTAKELWLIHHEKWQVIVSCGESSKMHVRVSIDLNHFFFFLLRSSQLVWDFFSTRVSLNIIKKTFKNVLFDTFFYQLSGKKATDNKTFRFGNEMRAEIHLRSIENIQKRVSTLVNFGEKWSSPYRLCCFLCHIKLYQRFEN